jgi:phospholipid transport system substrate-binding protein
MKATTALAAVVALGLASAPVIPASAESPDQVIQETSDLVLQALNENRETFRQDPDELYATIDDILLPRFDRMYSGGLVMGKYWRRATPEQRERFINALYHTLLRTYADGILDYRGDQLEVLPVEGDISDGKAVVETRVTLDTGVVTPVNYRMRLSDGKWKTYDLIIEGISYVSNYRSQYAEEFRAKGIETVIEELEARARGEDDSETAAEPTGQSAAAGSSN